MVGSISVDLNWKDFNRGECELEVVREGSDYYLTLKESSSYRILRTEKIYQQFLKISVEICQNLEIDYAIYVEELEGKINFDNTDKVFKNYFHKYRGWKDLLLIHQNLQMSKLMFQKN